MHTKSPWPPNAAFLAFFSSSSSSCTLFAPCLQQEIVCTQYMALWNKSFRMSTMAMGRSRHKWLTYIPCRNGNAYACMYLCPEEGQSTLTEMSAKQTCLSHAGIREPNHSHDCASGEGLASCMYVYSASCNICMHSVCV